MTASGPNQKNDQKQLISIRGSSAHIMRELYRNLMQLPTVPDNVISACVVLDASAASGLNKLARIETTPLQKTIEDTLQISTTKDQHQIMMNARQEVSALSEKREALLQRYLSTIMIQKTQIVEMIKKGDSLEKIKGVLHTMRNDITAFDKQVDTFEQDVRNKQDQLTQRRREVVIAIPEGQMSKGYSPGSGVP